MLPILSWLSLASMFALATPSRGCRTLFLAPAMSSMASAAADTGDTSNVLLTTTIVGPYAAASKELETYWHAHPDLDKVARDHGVMQAISTSSSVGISYAVPNYPAVVQQDTTVAGIFTRAQFAPTQFARTQRAIWSAILASLTGHREDTMTVAGKNMAFVQAHRAALAADWVRVQKIKKLQGNLFQQFQQGMQDHVKQSQDSASTDHQ